MRQWWVYFRLECKRMLKMVPSLLFGMVLFGIVICGVLFFSQTVLNSTKKEFEIIKVGIVGGEDEKYTKLAISMVEKMDTVKSSAIFEHCSMEEAESGLEKGDYDMIFLIPENYVKGFMKGENKTIVARFGGGQTGVTSYIMKQLSDFASNLLIQSEKNIYSMQDYYREIAPKEEKDALVDINVEYITQILARDSVFLTEEVTRTEGLPLPQYYFCDAILLILLFFGLQCAKLLQKNHPDLGRKLMISGVGTIKQLMARLGAFCITIFVMYILLVIAVLIGLPIAEEKGIIIITDNLWNNVCTLIKISLIAIPVATYIMLVYEVFEESVNGIIAFFGVTVVLAFVAGCFYPLSFMPLRVQALSEFTMTRAIFMYMADCLRGESAVSGLLSMTVHTAIMIVLLIVIRCRTMLKCE